MTHEHIKKMIKHNPHRVMEILEEMVEDYGEDILEYFNCHITTEATYNQYASELKNFNGVKGPHWTLSDIKAKCTTNFDEKDYTFYDYAYIVNMIYSDGGDLISVDNIFTYAHRYLSDPDYWGDPSQRAYLIGKMRHEYFN
jgi:hypothetical protein